MENFPLVYSTWIFLVYIGLAWTLHTTITYAFVIMNCEQLNDKAVYLIMMKSETVEKIYFQGEYNHENLSSDNHTQ